MSSKPVPLGNIVLVILAAGGAKRMGEPKQLLPWQGKTLIEYAIEKALEVHVKNVVVVLGANHSVIKNEIKNYPVEIIVNSEWNRGLGSSISRAVSNLMYVVPNFDGAMFVLADQPFVTSEYLKQMLEHFQPNSKQILTTNYNDGKLGVPTIFDYCYFEELSNLSEDKGANTIIKKYGNFVLSLDAPFENMDIDTKEDYERALKIISKK
ncbi:nucleotidyltransferase family protein [Tamlana crocina]|uniref:Nucleotidyltransferase family protein n=1 Tax=Tamlana crocina TaxID=393006 RepID=A0ABX1D782_9FLAO|nr:nucleotidyltransferase family protein [Tamlana crocina]NJX14222.1 nucleotidyltransferase family protein [Tamlana crocina]